MFSELSTSWSYSTGAFPGGRTELNGEMLRAGGAGSRSFVGTRSRRHRGASQGHCPEPHGRGDREAKASPHVPSSLPSGPASGKVRGGQEGRGGETKPGPSLLAKGKERWDDQTFVLLDINGKGQTSRTFSIILNLSFIVMNALHK